MTTSMKAASDSDDDDVDADADIVEWLWIYISVCCALGIVVNMIVVCSLLRTKCNGNCWLAYQIAHCIL